MPPNSQHSPHHLTLSVQVHHKPDIGLPTPLRWISGEAWEHKGHRGMSFVAESGELVHVYRGKIYTLTSEESRNALLALLDGASEAAKHLTSGTGTGLEHRGDML